jgi:peptidoglycan-associated lipoprotein
MRILHSIAPLLLALPIGCGKTSTDRAPSEPREGETHGERAREERKSDRQTAGTTSGTGEAKRTSYADYPVTVTGVFIEPTLATACGLTVSPRAFFEFDSTDLDKGDAAVLRHVANCLATGMLAGRRVELIGHADPRGPDAYNDELGRSRAQSVQDFLVSHGVTTDNIEVRSAGAQGASPSDPSEWPYDRRVDVVLVPSP